MCVEGGGWVCVGEWVGVDVSVCYACVGVYCIHTLHEVCLVSCFSLSCQSEKN